MIRALNLMFVQLISVKEAHGNGNQSTPFDPVLWKCLPGTKLSTKAPVMEYIFCETIAIDQLSVLYGFQEYHTE